jgi:hypothetical protein
MYHRRAKVVFDEQFWYRYDMLDFCYRFLSDSKGPILLDSSVEVQHHRGPYRNQRNHASPSWRRRVSESDKKFIQAWPSERFNFLLFSFLDSHDPKVNRALHRVTFIFSFVIALGIGLIFKLGLFFIIISFLLFNFLFWIFILMGSFFTLKKRPFLMLSSTSLRDALSHSAAAFFGRKVFNR